jgi:hypothetical protein
MNLNQLLDRTSAELRRTARRAGRTARGVARTGYTATQKVAHMRSSPKPDMDDVTLTRKVETEIFRGARSPKGKVDVNAVDGVVWLRGEVKTPAQIKSVEAKARAVPEVRDVENLLHLPKTPAPTRAKPGKPTSTREKKAEPRRFDRTPTGETKAANAEPTPAQVASEGSGRKPAPLGAKDPDAGTETSPTGGTAPATPDDS